MANPKRVVIKKPQKTTKNKNSGNEIPKSLKRKMIKAMEEQRIELEREEAEKIENENKLANLNQNDLLLSDDEDEFEDELDEDELPEEEYLIAEEMTKEDSAALEMFFGNDDDWNDPMFFMPENDYAAGVTVSDVIREKLLKEKQNMEEQIAETTLNPKIIEAYTTVGTILSKYKSGKLPQAVRLISKVKRWTDILDCTKPFEWSPNATFKMTNILVAELNTKNCQTFFFRYLLPIVRQDIEEHKTLNYHLYRSVRRALYKPSAFYLGFFLPLIMQDCSLREAIIISRILRTTSVPVKYSAAALSKLLEIEWNPIQSFFIKMFLDKKYNLPHSLIDKIVDHIVSFSSWSRTEKLPVIWHQMILSLAEHYRNELRGSQKAAILRMLKRHKHFTITPIIGREFQLGVNRGEEVEEKTFRTMIPKPLET
eukprot:TRINITY_DN1928_c0_g1_i1.p1 TRINITY_DN1928_c0_g1~~TRINITY_DN1928_c0_g1_i1.p1  ORF type:complete len:435 (+),score=113.80 TRINITY_DN1928_c0_g1_i1:29-1306(+)